jgi:NAD-dependent DNA ligase
MYNSDELKALIIKYDNAYRMGNAIVSDTIYDDLLDQLKNIIGEDDPFFKSSIKSSENDFASKRREALPKNLIMASMNKCKTINDIYDWIRLKNIPDTFFVISPKYDGISLAKEESSGKCWTRGGDNSGGLRSDGHLSYMNDVSFDSPYTFGEVIISRKNWELAKNSFDGDSARNGVSGLFRRDYVSSELSYVDFIRYGVVGKQFKTKSDVFDYLNGTQKIKVPYKKILIRDINEEFLKNLYIEYSKDYEIDGLIIEVDDLSIWESLGREKTSNNPKGSIAYKGSFEEVKETRCIAIENNISKSGNIIPVAILEPVKLDGAIVSRVTLNNYSFMKELGVGVGSTVLVKRSGFVIPLITEVLDKKDFVYPTDIECEWDENKVHLKTLYETDEQKKKKIFAFFQILGVENVSDKTFDLLYDSGYRTIKDILNMSKKDFSKLEGFGERKTDIVYESIMSKINNIPLSRLQHATGVFKSLGEKKLLLLEHFTKKPTIDEIIKIEGFSDILAKNYLDSYDVFFDFIKELPITWVYTKKSEPSSNELDGKSFCFSGIRDKNIEKSIESKGGKILSGVSNKTTHLIVKEKNSGSSKETKALELGITILTLTEVVDTFKL